jgi:hypothetical protein
MRKSFKYGLAFLAVCLVVAFFNRERFSGYVPSEPADKPVVLETPFAYSMVIRDGVPDDDKKVQNAEQYYTSIQADVPGGYKSSVDS